MLSLGQLCVGKITCHTHASCGCFLHVCVYSICMCMHMCMRVHAHAYVQKPGEDSVTFSVTLLYFLKHSQAW